MVVALLAMPIMTLLARRKIALATQLRSRAMRADAVESITCGWLSLVVVVGLVAEMLAGAWWVDSLTSLAIVWFVIKEAREAWSGEEYVVCVAGAEVADDRPAETSPQQLVRRRPY